VLLRVILFTHRYIAVAVGLLMSLWCLSGFVMMYQDYPAFTQAEKLRGLAPLDLSACCSTGFLPDDAGPLADFRIDMLGDEPVLRQSGAAPIGLRAGTPIAQLQQAGILEIASGYARRAGIDARPQWRGVVPLDQWTLQTARHNQPAHLVYLHDKAGTQLYVNAASGEIFQDTSRRERILNWLGAIPHWLYPTALRRNGPLWSQVVIWTAVLGTFLTLTGLYVGISRLQRRSVSGRVSPFRGWWYWHHMLGLVFGALTLTWVFSGLLTMNPWGLLEGSDIGVRVSQQLRGNPTAAELRTFLQSAPARLPTDGFVQLRGQAFNGALQVIALRADGSSLRLDANALPDPLQPATVEAVVRRLDTGVAQFGRLGEEDPYYYSHKGDVELPVYRGILADAQKTRLYISPATGALLNVVDADARRTRWFERALHGLDFRGLRTRPIWDVVTLLLLAGVTALAITGTWMALKRIRADLSPRD
jgi:uncharacterized iron-regulated membrane protein